jgi:flagellar biosynthesis protein FliP
LFAKVLTFFKILYIISKENKDKQSVVSSHSKKESEVIHMLEEALLQLLILSLFANIVLAIVSFILIIAIVIITYKKNHFSANH